MTTDKRVPPDILSRRLLGAEYIHLGLVFNKELEQLLPGGIFLKLLAFRGPRHEGPKIPIWARFPIRVFFSLADSFSKFLSFWGHGHEEPKT
jgi:hypothetical protein